MSRQQQTLSPPTMLPATRPARRKARREPILLGLCIVLLLLAVVPPLINLGRYQRRIAGAISRSIGRPVSMSSVSLRLLPWPALQIANLVVEEGPGFGAEPALMAPEVLAEPRLSSLWRGHFELNRVELSNASVNLVRNADGRWNISSVLLQASQIPNAPTAQARPGPAPRFPFIEATGTRINFKRGIEKLPYSLLNADFSMVLLRPEVWQLKLEGQPDRTDLDLSPGDTGTLRLEGQIHRLPLSGSSASITSMPLSLDGEWSHAPLGQLSRLLLGRDAGWRGDIDATAKIEGDLDHLAVRTHLLVADLHRQEFTPEQAFTLDATCRGVYNHAAATMSGLICRWPVGDGSLVLKQDQRAGHSAFLLGADKVPASFVVSALGLLVQGTPLPREFSGQINGLLSFDPASRQLAGSMIVPLLTMRHAGVDDSALVLKRVELLPRPGAEPAFLLSSDPVSMGLPAKPLSLSAELSQRGYVVHIDGSGTLAPIQALSAALHLPGADAFVAADPAIPASRPGSSQAVLDLALNSSGRWSVSDLPLGPSASVAGTVHLQNVLWRASWLPVPVSFPSLDATLSPGLIRWTSPAVVLGDGPTRLQLSGDAQVPLACDENLPCITHFTIDAASVDAATVQAAFGGGEKPMFSALIHRLNSRHAPLPALAGTIHADTLLLGRLPVHDASIIVSTRPFGFDDPATNAAGGTATIEGLDGRALGGRLHMSGSIALEGATPSYTVRASLTGASATQAAALWHESWGSGVLSGTAAFHLAGITAADLLSSARGSFHASWLHGSLAPALPDFADWDADGNIGPDGLTIAHGPMPGTTAALAGDIGWDRTLTMHFSPAPEAKPETLAGTLAAPVLSPAAPAETADPQHE